MLRRELVGATESIAVIGGGPAGLAAALVLARARSRVTVYDAPAASRSAAAAALHGWAGMDGLSPAELRERMAADLSPYPDVRRRGERVVGMRSDAAGVELEDERGARERFDRALLATGMVDVLPKIAGLRERWGRDAIACAQCHGWELRGRAWAVLATGPHVELPAQRVARWAGGRTVLLDGRGDVDARALDALRREGARIEPAKVASLAIEEGALAGVVLEGGTRVECGALLLQPPQRQCDLVLYAGIALDARGFVRIGDRRETSMPRVHACGDCAGARQQVLFAAADGAQAATEMLADP